MDISPTALVNASTQMQQSQVAQSAEVLVLKKALDIQATGALALLQALPLATQAATWELRSTRWRSQLAG